MAHSASAITVHVNKNCRAAKVDDNGGAGANVSYRLPRGPSIVLYLVHTCHLVLSKLELGLSESLRRAPGLSDQDSVRWNASRVLAPMVAPCAVEQR
jgi:hypothetical protein